MNLLATESHAREEEAMEQSLDLNEQRLGAVSAALKSTGVNRVLDLGCGEGRLLQALLKERQFTEIVGMDLSHRALEIARDWRRSSGCSSSVPGRKPSSS